MTKTKTRNHKSGRDVLSQTEKKSPTNSVPAYYKRHAHQQFTEWLQVPRG